MILYGHRGAKGEAPENTLPSFTHAFGLGVRAFELDVRLSADHEMMVLHDATVDRTTSGSGPVSEMTRSQLAVLDARADFLDWPEPCVIPTLTQVFDALPPTVRFELEVKRDETQRLEILIPKLIALIGEHKAAGRVTITSFEKGALRLAQRLAPHLPRGLIGAYDAPHFLETALELGCTQADIAVTTGSAAAVAAAHNHGLQVVGWPCDTMEQLQTLLDWNVDAVTTNFPGLILPVLKARGLISY